MKLNRCKNTFSYCGRTNKKQKCPEEWRGCPYLVSWLEVCPPEKKEKKGDK